MHIKTKYKYCLTNCKLRLINEYLKLKILKVLKLN